MPGSAGSAGYPPRIPPRCWRYRPRRSRSRRRPGARSSSGTACGPWPTCPPGELRLLSRSGRDMTRAYPELAELGGQAGPRDMVLDGEIAAFTGGRPSFAALQRRMHAGVPTGGLVAAVPVTYLVFDIMHPGWAAADHRALRAAAGRAGGAAPRRPAHARPTVVSRRREGRARGQRPRRAGGGRGPAPSRTRPTSPGAGHLTG